MQYRSGSSRSSSGDIVVERVVGEEGWNVEAGEVSLWSNEGRGGREGADVGRRGRDRLGRTVANSS